MMDQRKTEKKNNSFENDLAIVSTTVQWKIKNFTTIPKRQWIKSNPFIVSGRVLHLKVKRSSSCLYIYLFQENIPSSMSGLHFVISLIDPKGKPRFLCHREATVQEADNMILLENITESSLRKPFNLLPDDILTIRCNVFLEDEENSAEASQNSNEVCQHIPTEGIENDQTEKITCFETLSTDFGKYYDAHLDCDAVLKANGVDFPAHQAMLSARSAVLAEMIQQDDLKSNPKTLEIPNIQPNILDNLLFYVYSGKIRGLTSDTATRMFAAADNFALQELKDICLKFIHSNLTVENVGDVALLAETQDNEMLKEDVENFIKKNIANVLQSSQWKEFTQQQYVLANAILANVLLASVQGC